MDIMSRKTAQQIVLKFKALRQLNPSIRCHLPLPILHTTGKRRDPIETFGIEFIFRQRCRTENRVFIPF